MFVYTLKLRVPSCLGWSGVGVIPNFSEDSVAGQRKKEEVARRIELVRGL